VKPHAILHLRPGTQHADVGSWLQLLSDPGVAGPPFEPSVDAVFSRYKVDVAIVHEHEPARWGAWSVEERAVGLDRAFRVIALSGTPFPAPMIEVLRRLPAVERFDVGQVASVDLPAATAASRSPSSWASTIIGLEEAHIRTRGDPDVTIAVLDTGVWPEHPEYAGSLEAGFDFVDIIDGADTFLGDRLDADPDPSDRWVGHGSHVTGILVAQGKGMARGTAPLCRVLPVRVLGALRQGDRLIGAGLVDNISAGMKWAVDHGADVINMSLGVRQEGGGLPHIGVVRYAEAKGVSIIAAAGNDGTDTLYYPGALPGVVAVGAIDRDGSVADYSTWGDQVDLVAPGTEIWSSWLGDRYAFATGTSQATPFVAGAAALCQSMARRRGRRLHPTEVSNILRATADRSGRKFRDLRAGYGRLNVADALALTEYRLEATPRASGEPRSVRELVPA
jgi:thermitase